METSGPDPICFNPTVKEGGEVGGGGGGGGTFLVFGGWESSQQVGCCRSTSQSKFGSI